MDQLQFSSYPVDLPGPNVVDDTASMTAVVPCWITTPIAHDNSNSNNDRNNGRSVVFRYQPSSSSSSPDGQLMVLTTTTTEPHDDNDQSAKDEDVTVTTTTLAPLGQMTIVTPQPDSMVVALTAAVVRSSSSTSSSSTNSEESYRVLMAWSNGTLRGYECRIVHSNRTTNANTATLSHQWTVVPNSPPPQVRLLDVQFHPTRPHFFSVLQRREEDMDGSELQVSVWQPPPPQDASDRHEVTTTRVVTTVTLTGRASRLSWHEDMVAVAVHPAPDDDDTTTPRVQFYRFHHSTGTLTFVTSIPMQPPTTADDDDDDDAPKRWKCTYLQWFETHAMAIGYQTIVAPSTDEEVESPQVLLHIWDISSSSPSVDDGNSTIHIQNCTNLGDVIPFFDIPHGQEHTFYMTPLSDLIVAKEETTTYPILFVAANVGSDMAILMKQGRQWSIWEVDAAEVGLTAPVNTDDEFCNPTGMILLPSNGQVVLSGTDASLTVYTPSLPIVPRAYHLQHDDDDDDDDGTALSRNVEELAMNISEMLEDLPELMNEPPNADSNALLQIDTTTSEDTTRANMGMLSQGNRTPSSVLFGNLAPSSLLVASPKLSSSLAATTMTTQPSSTPAVLPSMSGPVFGRTSGLGGDGLVSKLGSPGTSTIPPPVATLSSTTTPEIIFGAGTTIPSFGGSTTFSFASIAATNSDTKDKMGFGFNDTSYNVSSLSPGLSLVSQEPSPSQVMATCPKNDAVVGADLEGTLATSGVASADHEANTPTTSGLPLAEGKAAKAFDLLDVEKTGSLSIDRIEDLLDELGEGFHGAELDDQVAAIDPENSGRLERAAVMEWYGKLSSDGTTKREGKDASSLQSGELEEQEEEREKARNAFESITLGNSTTIDVGDFPKLMEALATTYCEEEHVKTIERLQNDGKIELNDFLEWYVEWLFDGDESSDDDNDDDNDANNDGDGTTKLKGWGDTFAQKEGSWKCDACMVMNDGNLTQCAACETARPGFSVVPVIANPNGHGTPAMTFGTGGITFGTPGGFLFGTEVASNAKSTVNTGLSFGTSNTSGFNFAEFTKAKVDTAAISSEPKNKAGEAFDLLDVEKTGSLSIDRIEDLLDELGEGFHGAELDDQVAAIDPENSGRLERAAVIEWYGKLSSDGTTKREGKDASSLQSDELEEQEEEREKARNAFESITLGNSTTIDVGDFPKLMEALATTYCEEEHVKTIKRLQNDGKIELNDFLEWYVEWLFDGDESSDDDNDDDNDANDDGDGTTKLKGWGDTFAQKEGSWKCDACMVMNDGNLTQCAACETARPGCSGALDTVPTNRANGTISFGTQEGFHFGTGSLPNASTDRSKVEGAAERNAVVFGTSSFGSFTFPTKVAETTTTAPNRSGFQLSTISFNNIVSGITFGDAPASTTSSLGPNTPPPAKIPPIPKQAPSPIISPLVSSTGPAAGIPPMSKKAPTPIISTPAMASASNAAFPPISKKGPTPFGSSHVGLSSPIAVAPPMSIKAPTPVSKATTKPSLGFPPISHKAPTPFGASDKAIVTPIAIAPPMSTKPPAPIHKSIAPSAVFPPMSKTAPTPLKSAPGMTKSGAVEATSIKPPASLKNVPTLFGISQPPSHDYSASNSMSNIATGSFPSQSSPSLFGLSLSTSERLNTAKNQPVNINQSLSKADQKLSECSRQYENFVDQMHQSLTLMLDGRPKSDDLILRTKIEKHVNGACNAVADVSSLRTSVQVWKRVAAGVLSQKAEASRHLNESKRIIDELNDQKSFSEFLSEPLDCKSEERRRYLNARMIATKRIIGITKSRYDILSALESSEGDKFLLSSVVSLYDDVIYFEENTSRTESKAKALVVMQYQSQGTSTRYHLPRKLVRSKAPLPCLSDFNSDVSKRKNSTRTWNSIESAFRKLKTPPVNKINISTISVKGNDQAQGHNCEKLRVPKAQGDRAAFVFSPSLSTNSREAWNSSSRITQQQMQQVSFSPPRDLRETTVSFASPNALAEYGTNPEKMLETMRLSKLGMPASFEKKAASSQATPLFQSASFAAKSTIENLSNFTEQQPSIVHGREKMSNQAETISTFRGTKDQNASFDSSNPAAQASFIQENAKQGKGSGVATNSSSVSFADTSFDSLASTDASHSRNSASTLNSKGLLVSNTGTPDYLLLLTKFLEVHNPEKAYQASHHLEKYKGREYGLFAKLAKKYSTTNPLDDLPARQDNSPNPKQNASVSIEGPSQFMESSNVSSQIHSSTISSPIHDAGNSASARTGTASSPYTGFQNSPSSTIFSTVSSPFGQVSNSFGNTNEVAGGNNSLSIPTAASTGALFRGKSARELLTEFYREKNPSKISDVDHVLLKYQGREEEMFRNLAKKYALDPAIFGLLPVPSVSAIGGMSPPGIAGTPLAFGQPTPLGGGSPFGMAPSATPFGSPPVAFGQTFGSAGAIAMGGASFGALANAPVQAGFGALSSPQGAFGASPPFGGSSPFGAPRR